MKKVKFLSLMMLISIIFLSLGVSSSHTYALPADRLHLPVREAAEQTCGAGDVGGVVYRELPMHGANLNTYGAPDANELGVKDIQVIVTDAQGTVMTTTTDENGHWVITPAAYPVRVEFIVPHDIYLFDGPRGTDSFSDVQFADASNCNMNLGIHYPGDYSDDSNPLIAIAQMQNGDPTTCTDHPNVKRGIVTFTYDQQGMVGSIDEVDPDTGTTPPIDYTYNLDAEMKDVGPTGGMAYQRERKRLFAATFLRRHAAFKDTLGTIYMLDYTTSPPTLSSFDVTSAGIDIGSVCRDSTTCDPLQTGNPDDYTVSTHYNSRNRDLDAFNKVMKVGLGDIDISDDGNTLWAVNLYNKSLIRIDISGDTPVVLGETTLEGIPTCTNGAFRPFALKFYQGKGYLGGVCDASSGTGDDLEAYVLSFNPDPTASTVSLTTEVNFALNYARGDSEQNPPSLNLTFKPWLNVDQYNTCANTSNNYGEYPQPVLTDIEFFHDNQMFLGFADRWGYQTGSYDNYPALSNADNHCERSHAYGELLKACLVEDSNTGELIWRMEGSTSDCPVNFRRDETTQPPWGVGGHGEYFYDTGGDRKEEMAEGTLAILPGSGQLLTTTKDPWPHSGTGVQKEYWWNSGIHWLSLDTGDVEQYIQVFTTYTTDEPEVRSGFGKSNDVGDIELLLAPAPLEIGDRLWCDMDEDGIQDPEEGGIANATVTLECDIDGDGFGDADDVRATTTTDLQGNYIFRDGDANLTDFPVAYWQTSLHIIPRQTSCRILVDPRDSGISDSCGDTTAYAASPQDQGDNDRVDSDAEDNVDGNGNAGLVFLTPDSGQNDHDYDIGFQPEPFASLGDFVWWDVDEDGIQDPDEPGLQGVTVTLKDANGNTLATTTTDAQGAYAFDKLFPGSYVVHFALPGSGWSFSPQDQGPDNGVDSDANPNTGDTALIDLASGEHDPSIDAGLIYPADYTITKENTTQNTTLTPGDPISFTITIQNTGASWLATLPITDTYDTDYLTFVSAEPAADDTIDDGVISWSDLTERFGRDLAQGESFSVIVNFKAKASTVTSPDRKTINYAGAHDVTADPDGPDGPNGALITLPDQQDDASVSITDPVAVSISDFWARAYGRNVHLVWHTANEYDILGFNLLRSIDGGDYRVINESLIMAAAAGSDEGVMYEYHDRRVPEGMVRYRLQIVHLDGRITTAGQATVQVGRGF